jgi:mannosyltransferase OCH1-like enzyme
MIKQIFFIWLQGIKEIPEKMQENIEFVKEQNLDYVVRIIDLELFELFLKDKPLYLSSYFAKLNKKCYAMVSDFMRIVLLYYEGGVYLDVKTRPKKPLRDFIKEDKSYVFYVDKWSEYCNNFLVCKRGSELYRHLIQEICQGIDDYVYKYDKYTVAKTKEIVVNLTGPKLLTKLVNTHNYNDLIKIEGYLTKKYIQYSCVKYHHKHYESYTKFKEPLILFLI